MNLQQHWKLLWGVRRRNQELETEALTHTSTNTEKSNTSRTRYIWCNVWKSAASQPPFIFFPSHVSFPSHLTLTVSTWRSILFIYNIYVTHPSVITRVISVLLFILININGKVSQNVIIYTKQTLKL